MSYTKVVRPSTTTVSGVREERGSGSTSVVPLYDDTTKTYASADAGADQSARSGVACERVMQRHGTHYVLAPNPSRNSKLKQIASEEVDKYASYKRTKKQTTARELAPLQLPPRTLGGKTMTHNELAEARERQEKLLQKEARFAAVRSREKREAYRREVKKRDDDELQKMKDTQREKALKLEKKKEMVGLEELRRKRVAHFRSRELPY